MKKLLPVSIVSANYNNGLFLTEYFNSIIESNALPSQMCIVDDGSTDNSVEVIKEFKVIFESLGITFDLIVFENNQGFGNALNEALNIVKHEFSLRIDPDDILKPQRIDIQYSFMCKHPLCAVLGSNIEYFLSETKNILRVSAVPLMGNDIFKTLQAGCIPLIHGSTMFRSDIIKSFKYRQDKVPAEDYDLFSRIKKANYELCNTPDILTSVRVHEASVTNTIPFKTIEKTFLIREEVWSIKFSLFNARRRFYNQKYYRKYLFSSSNYRFVYFFMAAILWPESVIRNIKLRLGL
tara:strand:+ start:7657 stop:8538 length:882 start_codon:yes stop_codon:yes gene_type:complete